MKIMTERLTLLPCSLEILNLMDSNLSELETLLNVKIPGAWPTKDLKEIILLFIENTEEDSTFLGWHVWIVIDNRLKQVIGDIGFLGKPDNDGSVEIGYSIIPKLWRQGYATEAVKGLIGWVFNQPEVRRVIACCSEENKASIRVVEKAGFRQVAQNGELLEFALFKNQFS